MSGAASRNTLAARAVALHGGGTVADRRELLDMLGLVGRDGNIVPDRTGEASANIMALDDYPTRFHPTAQEPRPRNCTTPPGLANLPPLPATPAPVKAKVKPERPPRPPRELAPCGTAGALVRHRKLGEPICDACRERDNEYARARRARKRAEREAAGSRPGWKRVNPDLPPRPETCGSLAGRSNHMRRGEALCDPCKAHYLRYCQERRDRAKAAREQEQSA